MRHLELISLTVFLRGDRQLNVEVGPDFVVHTDAAGRITGLAWSNPPGERFDRLRYLDVAEVVAITANEYWVDDYADDVEAEEQVAEPEPFNEGALESEAMVGESEPEPEAEPLTTEVLAAVAEVRRIMGQVDTEGN